jgi:glutamate/tyrosine decarboxylase-like PLP-dependent enzyme
MQTEITNIDTPYTTFPRRAMCYPGTTLCPFIANIITNVPKMQINMIGTHTINSSSQHEDNIGEGGFEIAQYYEREFIWWVGRKLCKHDPEHIKDLIDGYMNSGATESNIEGLWIAREYLRSLDPSPIYVVFTALTHYSITKAMHLLDIKNHQIIKHDDDFSMDINDLRDTLNELMTKTKNVIIIGNVGTTACGSIDSIHQINSVIDEFTGKLNVYFHVDAAFGGFTVPFAQDSMLVGFENSNVKSIAIDGHKMGRLPYPSGIFLCRKGLQQYVERRVQYIRGHSDDTVIGSRSAVGPICGFKYKETFGYDGHKQYVNECLINRDRLSGMLSCLPFVTILPHSPYTNMLPVIINVENGKIPEKYTEEGLLKDYHLRNDEFMWHGQTRTVYKLCIMEHTFPVFEQFIKDLLDVYQAHNSHANL